MAHARAGHAEAPPDSRFYVKSRVSGPREASMNVDRFLHWCYTTIAEYLPGGVDKGQHSASMDFPDLNLGEDPEEEELCAIDKFIKESDGVEATTNTDMRYLPHMTMDAFFALFQAHGGTSSKSVFLKVHKANWAKKLAIRRQDQHATCNECVRFKVMRASATSPAEHKVVSMSYKKHLDDMYIDRVVDERLCAMSRNATAEGAQVAPGNSVLSVCVDAMDQSKFRVPRGGLTSPLDGLALG